jgi:hypothetical protein
VRRLLVLAAAPLACAAAALSAADRPAPDTRPVTRPSQDAVTITHPDGRWSIVGRTVSVTLDERTLGIEIAAGPARWAVAPSTANDMRVRADGQDFQVALADARSIAIVPYETGFKSGVKLTLGRWRQPASGGHDIGLELYLTVCLEGTDEDLVFEVAADERGAAVRQLDWPGALDARAVDFTVLNTYRGTLLPRTWPKPYNPIRADASYPNDTTEIQSNVIESWSMPWWGFEKGASALMVLVETPEDAAYRFEHPAGGPTVIGPRWRSSLGRLAYPRRARLCFFASGNYVDLAKRYRQYAIDSGLFVSLRDKITRSPKVQALIGTPLTRLGILRNFARTSARYDEASPAKNYSLTTFDERARQLRALKAGGLDHLHVCLTGWPQLGYDRQHPDVLPPAPAAGGWDGLRRLAETVRALGYLFTLHDQYRDYYVDAPSYDPQFAIHEEDERASPQAFPGSRFGSWKTGRIPFMNRWDGGTQTYLNSRFMLGHLVKTYQALFGQGIRPDGSYLDVFGYVPPDEDFNPEHPTTRAQAIHDRAACYLWVRHHLGVVGTEAAVDWVVPYVDFSSPLRSARAGIPVPLYNLVYHDAIITPYAPDDLNGFVNGGLPQIALADADTRADRVRQMAALHRRVALLEMTRHEWLDPAHRRERSTFADGTSVEVDWNSGTVSITP